LDFELDLEKYLFTEHKEFDVTMIRIDQKVREMCEQNKCGFYGRNHMCPPAIKCIEEWAKEIFLFKSAVIVTKAYPTKSSFDMRAMFEGLVDFRKTLLELKEDVGAQLLNNKILLLGAGTCFLCEKCTIIDNKSCRFPDKTFPSVEACGIDVMSLCKEVGVNYNNGKNTITYIGILLY